MKPATRETVSLALMLSAVAALGADMVTSLWTIDYAGAGFVAALILIIAASIIAE